MRRQQHQEEEYHRHEEEEEGDRHEEEEDGDGHGEEDEEDFVNCLRRSIRLRRGRREKSGSGFTVRVRSEYFILNLVLIFFFIILIVSIIIFFSHIYLFNL